jgi:arylsulfatase A-like enzyme
MQSASARSLALLWIALTSCTSHDEVPTEASQAEQGGAACNVILIMTDDQGFGDLSVHGNPVLETPHLDRLASESVQLQHFYVHPVCTPTRAALFTGRHPQRHDAIDTYRGRAMLEPEAVTIAEALSRHGMNTGLFGKWHLGDCAPMRPIDQGFTRSVVHRGGGIGQPSDPLEAGGRYTDPILMDQGEPRKFRGYCTDVYFEQAMAFMQDCRQQDRPFFCAITPNAPHTPLHDVPEELYRRYRSRALDAAAFDSEPGRKSDFHDEDKLARLYAMVANIDDNIGRLLSFLDEEGLTENTLLVFLCDNGPQGRRFNAGLRAAKGSIYEGGVRSPLFCRWPARLEPGVRSRGIGAHIDLFPTVCDAVSVPLPEDTELDGTSLLPLLQGSRPAADQLQERPIVIQWHRGDVPIENHHAFVRLGDLKLVQATTPWQELNSPPAWQPELYDLSVDPYEQHDLAADRPDAVEMLRGIYREWFADVVGPADEHPTSRRLRYAPSPIQVGGPGAESVVLTRQDWRPHDSKGWGSNGSWNVAFEDHGPWRVTVTLPRNSKATEVEFGVNSGVWTWTPEVIPVAPGANTAVFEAYRGVWLTNRSSSVTCTLLDPEGKRLGGPHQVRIER